jgi:hypothetical protein
MKGITNEAIAKRSIVFRKYQLKLVEKVKLMKWEKYYEHYFFDLKDMYTMDDFEMATGTGEWIIDKNDINEHDLAIK